MRFIIYFLAFFTSYVCFGAKLIKSDQVMDGTVLIGSPSGVGSTADASAQLEVKSTTKGLLPPRMTTAQRDAISSPATGLVIFNTSSTATQFYNGSAWKNIGTSGLTASRALETDASGDITSSDVTSDELNYLDGVTSSIQTQLNAKQSDVISSQGSIAIGDASGNASELTIGAADFVLTSNGTTATWASSGGAGATAETVISLNDFTANSGFETGDATNWTNSGATASVQAVTILDGSYSLSWDAAADGDTFTSDAFTIPEKLKNNNVVFCFLYQGGDENIRFIVNDGTNDFVDETLSTQADSYFHCTNTVMPDVATITLRLEADADAAVIYADNFAFALASTVNISQILDSVYSARIASNDTITSQAGDFISSVASTSTGIYVITFTSDFFSVAPSVSAAPETANTFASISSLSATGVTVTINDNSGTDTDSAFTLRVQKQGVDYASNQAINPSTQMVASGVKITADAAHIADVTNASYTKATDTDVVSGDKTHYGTAVITSTAGDFGFQMPYLKANTRYKVFANVNFINLYSTSTTTCVWSIYDGTNNIGEITNQSKVDASRGELGHLSGTIEYSSVQKDIEFTIYGKRTGGAGSCFAAAFVSEAEIGIIPLTEGMNNPQILNNVVSSSSDGERICRVNVTNSGTPTIAKQSGSCVSSLTDSGVGITTVNFLSGVFSDTQSCSVTSSDPSYNLAHCNISALSTSSVQVNCELSSDGTDTDFDFSLKCTGDK